MKGKTMRCHRNLTLPLVVSVITLGLGGVLEAQQARAVKGQKAQVTAARAIAAPTIKDPTKADHVLDLRPILAKKKLREGVNYLATTDQGVRVSAKVKQGEIVELITVDAEGNSGKALKVANPARASTREGSGSSTRLSSGGGTTGEDDPHCWHCYEIKGKTHCYEIKCPWL
jgi:hypothetical protein